MDNMTSSHDPFAQLPSILTVEEAAELLRVTDDKLRNLIKEGTIPGVRIGRTFRIYRNELRDALDGTRVTGDDADESHTER